MIQIVSKNHPAYWAIVFSLLMVTSGCTQIARPPVKSSVPVTKKPNTGWEQRKANLSRKNNWNLVSKVGLGYREEYWQFGLDWAQRAANQYAMQIKNPLTGAIVAKLTQTPQGAILLADDGKTYRSNNAEQLLQSQTGVHMPVNGMPYWVRGVTSPQYKVDRLVLDKQGRPSLIQQAGWLIRYPAYKHAGTLALPRKITFKRSKDNVSVKLVAKRWQGT
jgi:outer membrane lipoprotein LolB